MLRGEIVIPDHWGNKVNTLLLIFLFYYNLSSKKSCK
jgi:hypothetical protein